MFFIDNWVNHYPNAGGKNQSPIDIITPLAEYDETLKNIPFEFNFDLNCFIEIKNNGHTFVVSAASDNTTVSGGLTQNPYRFAQFHMHWGLDESHGSEHFVDGSPFAGELHFVFWNSTKYPSFESAAQSNAHDGLLVFGVFVIIGAEHNEFNKITTVMDNVRLANHTTFVSRPLEIIKLFPSKNYFNQILDVIFLLNFQSEKSRNRNIVNLKGQEILYKTRKTLMNILTS